MAENKLLDDLAKFGNSTITTMNSLQRQVRKWVWEQVETMVKGMDLITHEEMDIQKTITDKKIAELEERIKKLEGQGAAKASPAKKAPAKKAKKPAAKKKPTVTPKNS